MNYNDNRKNNTNSNFEDAEEWKQRYEETVDQLQAKNDEVEIAKHSVGEYEQRIESLTVLLENKKSKINELTAQLENAMAASANVPNQQLESPKMDIDDNNDDKDTSAFLRSSVLESQVETLTGELERLKEDFQLQQQEKDTLVLSLQSELDGNRQELDAQSKILDLQNQEVQSLKLDHLREDEHSLKKIHDKEREIETVKNLVLSLQSELDVQRQELEAKTQELELKCQEVQSLKSHRNEPSSEVSEKEKELKMENNQDKNRIRSLQSELDQKREELEAKTQELEAKTQELELKCQEVQSLTLHHNNEPSSDVSEKEKEFEMEKDLEKNLILSLQSELDQKREELETKTLELDVKSQELEVTCQGLDLKCQELQRLKLKKNQTNGEEEDDDTADAFEVQEKENEILSLQSQLEILTTEFQIKIEEHSLEKDELQNLQRTQESHLQESLAQLEGQQAMVKEKDLLIQTLTQKLERTMGDVERTPFEGEEKNHW
eukprot:Awhi_evm1s2142